MVMLKKTIILASIHYNTVYDLEIYKEGRRKQIWQILYDTFCYDIKQISWASNNTIFGAWAWFNFCFLYIIMCLDWPWIWIGLCRHGWIIVERRDNKMCKKKKKSRWGKFECEDIYMKKWGKEILSSH